MNSFEIVREFIRKWITKSLVNIPGKFVSAYNINSVIIQFLLWGKWRLNKQNEIFIRFLPFFRAGDWFTKAVNHFLVIIAQNVWFALFVSLRNSNVWWRDLLCSEFMSDKERKKHWIAENKIIFAICVNNPIRGTFKAANILLGVPCREFHSTAAL